MKSGKKKIAIVGAGFCGLAVAFLAQERIDCQIDLYDPSGIGGGASGIAAGLLHPFAGAHNKLNPFAFEGMKATLELIKVAEEALGKPVANFSGILRPATNSSQELDFQKAAHDHPDIIWQTAKENQKLVEGLNPFPGIFIHSGAVVDSNSYLQGLFKACSGKGLTLINEAVDDLASLDHYDAIIVTAGASCRQIKGLENLAINLIKGQVLIGNWPKENIKLPFPLNSHAYLLMQSPTTYCAGATYERDFTTPLPDLDAAIDSILPKVEAFFPSITKKSILDCKAAIRATTPNRLPLIHRHNHSCFVLTGMGSKGLLYHALYAKQVIDELLLTL